MAESDLVRVLRLCVKEMERVFDLETPCYLDRAVLTEAKRALEEPRKASSTDPWEAVRHLTLDQLITRVKLAGGALPNFQLHGYTTPEHFLFRLMLFIGKPGNEVAMELASKLTTDFTERARAMVAESNPNLKRPKPGSGKNPSELADQMQAKLDAWYAGEMTRMEIESFVRFGNLTEEEKTKLNLITVGG